LSEAPPRRDSWTADWQRTLVKRLGLSDHEPRAAALAVSSAAIVGVCLVSVPLHLSIGNPDYVPLSMSGTAGFLGVMFAVLRMRNTPLAGALYAISSLITLTPALLIDGGLASSAAPWLAMMPAISYALGGLRAGIVGLVGTGLLTIGLAVFEPAIQATWPPAHDSGQYAVHLVLVSLAMVSLVVAREVARDKAREQALVAETARIAAEAASRSKSRVLASVSHEIRTPLNGVLGNVELLLSEAPTAPQRARLSVVQDSGELLLSILDDVLDMARIEADQLAIAPEPTAPDAVVHNAAELLRPRAEAGGITLKVVATSQSAQGLLLDGHRLRQVVLNLVGNAIKFTPRGGTVTVRHGLGDTHWQCAVVDTGIGIPADRIDAIFDPFVQAEDHTARRFGGTGLGLPISRRITELMHGTLTVRSTPGEGSVFTLRLPAERVELPQPARPPANSHRKPLQLLVVDDNQVNLQVMQAMLGQLGHAATLASGGAQALDLATQARFDAVLMDIEMPGMDGLEATRRLRADPHTAGLPIYAVTASAFPGDRQRAADAGMDAFLPKPVRFTQLAELLGQASPGRP